jgi:hypothetical protein
VSDLPPDGPGLYFLVKDEQVIYVGSSDHPSKRVWSHSGCKHKAFDYEVYLAISIGDDLLAAERHWIRTLCPRHNKTHNPRPDPAHPGWGDGFSPSEPVRLTKHLVACIRMAAAAADMTAPAWIKDRLLPIALKELDELPKRAEELRKRTQAAD